MLPGLILRSTKAHYGLVWLGLVWLTTSCGQKSPDSASHEAARTNVQTFAVKGIVNELKPDGRTAVIKHEAISNDTWRR